ncbi:LIM-type zinc finger-containing protein [Heterostelium album PN500]|uniref:LIM-type zinc finger-containing protein n=1 Tax=Heterostelium pallidum (strain ATCC 26659 / Pp 5 / PN500) TaxID=670386 RepID=D3B9C8_HETP5|nr:LIM-type zinc finger-containing protein [Heterostelium album PN500]EFA81840.1 LIM-type zinc finger-containing protein [Heterostelium album PN500]|eukprot:XP_020433957.1 LIM-type zinc finger-containing protein [Heterostelium album PN500]
MATKFGTSEKCVVCTKTVYSLERLAADERIFHKACFRCTTCNNALKLGSYASMEQKTYCKPCFKKLFFSKGNYSEGFGQLKPQHQHDLKKGTPTVTSVEPVQIPVNSSVVEPTATEVETASS